MWWMLLWWGWYGMWCCPWRMLLLFVVFQIITSIWIFRKCICHLALAATSKAFKVWANSLPGDLSKPEIVDALKYMKLSSNFITEALMDLDNFLAHIILYSVTRRRALCFIPGQQIHLQNKGSAGSLMRTNSCLKDSLSLPSREVRA